MEIIAYEEKYRQAVEDICIATASQKAREDQNHHDYTLWMYCDAYLDRGICYLLMADERPVGYVLCAPCYEDWRTSMESYAEKINALPQPYPTRLQMELEEYGKDSAYPAHLHIDILEGYRGNGNGTRLLETLFARCRKEHVSGIMLGVAASNEKAIAFYKKNGFTIIEGDQYGYSMGIQLDSF